MSTRSIFGAPEPAIVRTATIDDIAAVFAVERATPAAAHWTLEQYKARIEIGKHEACFLVAESGGKICGFICAHIIAGEWEIENVAVVEGSRRRGVGSALLHALIGQWEELGGTLMLLEVRESNAAARELYTKHGLHETGRRRLYYRDPIEDAVLYNRVRKR
jgi:ribosomal-protein-alanine N-acetyltransferase